MKTFFTIVAAIGSVAIAQQDVDDYCCELFTEENFDGKSVTVCLDVTNFVERVNGKGYSFVTCSPTNGEGECEGEQHIMTDNMESYRCGAKVNASFCEGEYTKEWDYN